jgi:hypothetical protein
MPNLVTLQELKSWIGETGTGYDAPLTCALQAASDWICEYAGQDFLAAERREHRDGNGQPSLWLRQRPVQDVISVRGPTRVDALQVKYAAFDSGMGNMATVEVEDGESLKLTTSLDGTRRVDVLVFSTYKNLSLLRDAIEGVAGWTAEVLATDDRQQESAELLPMQPGDAYGQWLTLSTTDLPIDGYHWESWGEIVRRDSEWSWGQRNWTFRYVAGYGIAGEPEGNRIAALPGQLRLAALELAKLLYLQRRQDPDMRSEHLGDYGYSRAAAGELGTSGMPLRIEKMLAPFTRVLDR